jgi:hypothetical protein
MDGWSARVDEAAMGVDHHEIAVEADSREHG